MLDLKTQAIYPLMINILIWAMLLNQIINIFSQKSQRTQH